MNPTHRLTLSQSLGLLPRVVPATRPIGRNDGAMSGFTQTKPRKRLSGPRPLSHEERPTIKAGVPAWAVQQFVTLAKRTGMTMSSLAAFCLVRELNTLREARDLSSVEMPRYLEKQAAALSPQPQLLEAPLFSIVPESGNETEYLRLRVPESVVHSLDDTAAGMVLSRSNLAAWLILTNANRVRAELGMDTVPLPSDLDEWVTSAARHESLEATLVS